MTILDGFDLTLIDALEKDGTQTQRALGQRLGASEATIRRRMQRISKQRAVQVRGIPNLSALGYDLLSLIGLRLDLASQQDVISSLVAHPMVRFLASYTGRFHVMAMYVCRSRSELASFLANLTAMSGVVWVETFLTVHVYKNHPWSVDDAEPRVASDVALSHDSRGCPPSRPGATAD